MTDLSLYFAVGSSLETMLTFAELGIIEPFQDAYDRFSVEVEATDALVYGHGVARTAMRWGFIYLDQRNILKTFCAGKSAVVYLRLHDEDWDWVYCKAVLVWPKETPPVLVEDSKRIIPEFVLEIKVLENYGAELP